MKIKIMRIDKSYFKQDQERCFKMKRKNTIVELFDPEIKQTLWNQIPNLNFNFTFNSGKNEQNFPPPLFTAQKGESYIFFTPISREEKSEDKFCLSLLCYPMTGRLPFYL